MKRFITICVVIALLVSGISANAVMAGLADMKEAVGSAQFIVRGIVKNVEECTPEHIAPFIFFTDFTYKLVTLEIKQAYNGNLPQTIRVVHSNGIKSSLIWESAPKTGEERIYMITCEKSQLPPNPPIFFADYRSNARVEKGIIIGDPDIYKTGTTLPKFKSMFEKNRKFIGTWLDSTIGFTCKFGSVSEMAQESDLVAFVEIGKIEQKEGLHMAKLLPKTGYKVPEKFDWSASYALPESAFTGQSYFVFLKKFFDRNYNEYYWLSAYDGAFIKDKFAETDAVLRNAKLLKTADSPFGKVFAAAKCPQTEAFNTGITADITVYTLAQPYSKKTPSIELLTTYVFKDAKSRESAMAHSAYKKWLAAQKGSIFAKDESIVVYQGGNDALAQTLLKDYGDAIVRID